MEMDCLSIRMEKSAVEKLDRLARATGRTRANVLRRLVALAEDTHALDMQVNPGVDGLRLRGTDEPAA
jgi:predicted DNA-binding protein